MDEKHQAEKDQHVAPPKPAVRVRELDALRGFAMCGIVFVNIVQISGMPRGPRESSQNLGGLVYELLAYQRFFPIFSFLFGLSFAIFLYGAAHRHPKPRLVLLRRLVVLAVIGLLHSLAQIDEVLRWYALFGIVFLVPASYLSTRWVLIAAAVLLIPGLLLGGLFIIPSLLLAGLAAGQAHLAETIDRRTRQLLGWGGIAVVLSLAGSVWQAYGGVGSSNQVRSLPVGIITALLLTCAFLLLLCTPLRSPLLAVFCNLGRMALTNYLLATALILLGIEVLDVGAITDYRTVLLLGLSIGVVQALISPIVLRYWRYGPVEWLWRCLTWWQVVPLTHRTPTHTQGDTS